MDTTENSNCACNPCTCDPCNCASQATQQGPCACGPECRCGDNCACTGAAP